MKRLYSPLSIYHHWGMDFARCFLCGNKVGLGLHHMDPGDKEDDIFRLASQNKTKEYCYEINKVIPLCEECHIKRLHPAMRNPYMAGEYFTDRVPWNLIKPKHAARVWTSLSGKRNLRWRPSVIDCLIINEDGTEKKVIEKEVFPFLRIDASIPWPSDVNMKYLFHSWTFPEEEGVSYFYYDEHGNLKERTLDQGDMFEDF